MNCFFQTNVLPCAGLFGPELPCGRVSSLLQYHGSLPQPAQYPEESVPGTAFISGSRRSPSLYVLILKVFQSNLGLRYLPTGATVALMIIIEGDQDPIFYVSTIF